MEKLKIEVHEKHHNGNYGTLGLPYLMNCLKSSDLFEIGFHDEVIRTARDFRATIVKAEGKSIYIDFWEYPAPAYTNNVYDADLDLIVKIQDCNEPIQRFHRYLNRKGMLRKSIEEITEFRNKFVPCTFFQYLYTLISPSLTFFSR